MLSSNSIVADCIVTFVAEPNTSKLPEIYKLDCNCVFPVTVNTPVTFKLSFIVVVPSIVNEPDVLMSPSVSTSKSHASRNAPIPFTQVILTGRVLNQSSLPSVEDL